LGQTFGLVVSIPKKIGSSNPKSKNFGLRRPNFLWNRHD